MKKNSYLRKLSVPTLYCLLYFFISQISYTLLLTIITSFVHMKGEAGIPLTNSVHEISSQYLLFAFCISAFLTCYIFWSRDKALTKNKIFWSFTEDSKNDFIRGLISGALIALIPLALLCITGQINYLGIFITSIAGTPAFFLLLGNFLALCVTIFCEEYIFRHKILSILLERFSPLNAILFSTLAYIVTKRIQFELRWMDYLSLSCLNIILGFFYIKSQTVQRGLGFLLAIYCIIHIFIGLPLWGHQSPGFFFFKNSDSAFNLITGADSGPLAGLVMFIVLFLHALVNYFAWARTITYHRTFDSKRL